MGELGTRTKLLAPAESMGSVSPCAQQWLPLSPWWMMHAGSAAVPSAAGGSCRIWEKALASSQAEAVGHSAVNSRDAVSPKAWPCVLGAVVPTSHQRSGSRVALGRWMVAAKPAAPFRSIPTALGGTKRGVCHPWASSGKVTTGVVAGRAQLATGSASWGWKPKSVCRGEEGQRLQAAAANAGRCSEVAGLQNASVKPWGGKRNTR